MCSIVVMLYITNISLAVMPRHHDTAKKLRCRCTNVYMTVAVAERGIYVCLFNTCCTHVVLIVVYVDSIIVMPQPTVQHSYLTCQVSMRLSVVYERFVKSILW